MPTAACLICQPPFHSAVRNPAAGEADTRVCPIRPLAGHLDRLGIKAALMVAPESHADCHRGRRFGAGVKAPWPLLWRTQWIVSDEMPASSMSAKPRIMLGPQTAGVP